MQLISKYRKWFRFLLCVIDIYSKYAWVVPLKDKKVITITNAFRKTWNESNRKSNKIWVHKCGEFYKRLMKWAWSPDNDIKTYSTYSEGKSVLAERFIKNLQSKIYKNMISLSKNV